MQTAAESFANVKHASHGSRMAWRGPFSADTTQVCERDWLADRLSKFSNTSDRKSSALQDMRELCTVTTALVELHSSHNDMKSSSVAVQ